MNLMKSVLRLTQLINESNEPVKLSRQAITKLFLYSPKNLNGFEHAERIGITLLLYGQDNKSEQLLKIVRSFPKQYSDILLLLLLVADVKSLLLTKGPKRCPIGKPIQSVLNSVPSLLPYGQRSAPPSISPIKLPEETPEEGMTFEKFIKLRFADVRNNEVNWLNHKDASRFIQQILCGYRTEYTDIVDNKIVQTGEVRFEYHTFSSTKTLLKKFIEIGNTRINLMHNLRDDAISYEIRRHLTKFDAYVAILNGNSPAALLTKIRPFHQVFQWISRLLSFSTFSELHSELIRSSQTHFKSDLSMKLWIASFQEFARPFYSFSFLSDVDEVSDNSFQAVFESVKFDCIAAGNFLRLLRDTVPSHPIFDLSEEYMERFLKFENCIKEYKKKCEDSVAEIELKWLKYHKDQYHQRMQEFEHEKYQIRDNLHQQEMIMILKMKQDEQAKQERLEQLQKEIDDYDRQKREREVLEKTENKKYVDDLVANNAVTPIFRPMTEEEQLMIEREKLDLFMDFRKQMLELGASEEKILSFFPELNLPENELQALGIEYEEAVTPNDTLEEEKPEEKTESETQNEPQKDANDTSIIVSEQIQDEIHEISQFDLGLNDEEDEEESFVFETKSLSPKKESNDYDEENQSTLNLTVQLDAIPQIIQDTPEETEDNNATNSNFPIRNPIKTQNEETNENDQSSSEVNDQIENTEIELKEPELKTIPALFHRLIIPSFKLQYHLVSKALFSILKTRNQFQNQINALSKIFLISSSSQSCEFLQYFTDIPYGPASFLRISKLFSNSAENLGFQGMIQMGFQTEPPISIAEVLVRINETPIEVKPDPIFNLLLPSGIIQCYISMFRIILMLKLARAAVDKMWYLSRDSYLKRIALRASNLMLKFVICTETYFHATALAPAAKELEQICDDVETVEECNKKHENVLRVLLARCLLTPNTKAIRVPLLQSLIEICKYVYDPMLNGEKVTTDEFEKCAGNFALILHELNRAISENQMFRFLDILFSDFLIR